MVEIRALSLEGLYEIRPGRHVDQRGFFSEVWRDDLIAQTGSAVRFVQDNHSYSRDRGVLRGLHYQLAPAAQAKLVRVSHGSVFDVAVDIRRGSPSFGRWAGIVLSANEWNQVFIPEGFAHGFVALEPSCEVLYKTSAFYDRSLDCAIRFDDPDIGIDWPIEVESLIISERDRAAPFLRNSKLD